jgi:low affinity Fe/Cu permease
MLNLFSRFSRAASSWLGHPAAFCVAALSVLVWACFGPVFGYSDAWQLVINTSTTILTFLMIFLVQNTQNRDAKAMHIKLDELLRVSTGRNALINLENFSDEELETYCKEFADLHGRYQKALEGRRDAKHAEKARSHP